MKELLLDGAARHICIKFPNSEYGDITTGILSESISLERILNSSTDLNFGECNASKFEVEVTGAADISGLKIQVYELVDGYGNEIMLFTGIVDSAKVRPERDARQIMAYDEIHYHSDDNVSEWYDSMFSKSDKEEYKGVWSANVRYVANNTVQYNGVYYQYICGTSDQFSVVTNYDDDGNEITTTHNAADYCKGKTPEQLLEDEHGYNYIQRLEVYNPYNYGSVTLKQFRTSLLEYVGIQQEDVVLLNDDVLITKTLDSTELKFSDCIKAVCQMAGCFGHMSETGVFQYVYLGQVDAVDYSGNYKASNSSYEEYKTKPIDSVRIYDNAGVASTIYGSGDNPWNLQNNFLLYGLGTDVLGTIAKALYGYVSIISYTPASIEALLSFPIRMGSKITVTTHTEDTFSFYALHDTLSGGQLTSQVITASGSETRSNNMTLSNQLALLESKTAAIVEEVYQKIVADSAEIKTIYGDLANYKVIVAEKIQAQDGEFENLFSKQANFETTTIQNLTVVNGHINTLSGDLADYKTVVAGELQAIRADIGELDVTKLTARVATIEEAYIDEAKVNTLLTGYATISQLNATNANVTSITGRFSTFEQTTTQELIAAKGWMLEGAIGSAQISDLDVNKLKSGTLNTSIVNIAGPDGRLQIIDNTIQISDEDRVRVQVGKDASGDYTLAVWDSAGNLIWDALGATENTIQRKIIRDKMVADDAAIQALKIDFQSFDTALTEQGVVISGTVVQVGSKMLEVALSEQEQTIGDYGETLSSHDARITANEKSISLKVSTQDFTTYQTTVTGQISAAKSEAISTAASDASTKADNAKSAAVTAAASDATAKANQALADAKSYTNAEITTVNKSLSTTNQEISVMQGQIALKVEQTDIDTAVTNIEIGGRNLFKGYDDGEIRLKDYNNTGSFTQFFNLAFDPADYVGEKFTISFYAKSPNGATQLRLYNANNSPRYFCFSTTLDNALGTDWKYYTYTFVNVDRGSSYAVSNKVEIYAPDKMGVLVKKIKVEKGNKATDWTPAPEDVDASITAVDNKFASYSTTTQMQSAIDLAKNAITQSVSETYATKSQVNTVSGNVTTLTSRVSAAESKLTKDSLVTTIGSYYATQTALNTTNSNVTAAQSTANTANTNAAAAQTTANNAYNLANAKGIDYSQGKMLHTDPMFASGTNSCSAYNNSSNGTVTVTRTAKSSDNPMTGTSYELMIKTAGTASPGLGGYVQSVSSRANAVFIRRIIAKIPTGYTLAYAQNAMGTGYTVQWLTPNAGTGKFAEYVYKYVCGPTGTFSNGGHVYLSGAAATSASPVTWYVAYSTTFDMTNVSDAILAQTVATQTQEKFNWIVKSGTSATDFTLTDRTATLVANAINLNGLVTFSGLDSTAQGKITAAQSTADTAKANAATAQGTADTAKTAAATAQSTANTANTRATYHYGTCATAAATAAKAVTLSGFALYTGATISVKFTYANTAASPTLNVNSTGAKPIYVYGAALAASSAYNWVAGATVQFTYNGTQWVMTDTSAMKAVANWCYSNNLSYINGGTIYAGTVAAAQIAAGAITTDKLAANAVTAAKINAGAITTDKLAANAVTAEKINVNDLFAQDITATGTITGVNLVGATGSFSGSIAATSGTIAGFEINENGLTKNLVGNTYIFMGKPSVQTEPVFKISVPGTSGFEIKANGACHAEQGIYCDEIMPVYRLTTGTNISGNIGSSDSMFERIYSSNFLTGAHSNSWINVLQGAAGLNVQSAGVSSGLNGLARVKCTSGAWAMGALNTNNGFYLAYATESRLNSGTNGYDRGWGFYTNGDTSVPGNINCAKGHGLYSDTTGTNLIRQADMTNYNNLTCVSNTNYPTSIYTNGQVWKNGSSSTYFATTSSSDKRLKEQVSNMSVYEKVFARLSPVAFRYHEGLYNAPKHKPLIQWGFYAQDVIQAFKENGIDWQEQELVVVEDGDLTEEEKKYVSPGTLLKMNYQNLTALNTHMIQKNSHRLAFVESIQDRHTVEISYMAARQGTQEAQIESLQYQLNEARAQIAQQAAELARLKGMLQAAA